MKRPIDRLISSSRSEYFRSQARIDGSRDERCGHSRVPSPERRAPVGYALLILMMMVTLLLISLTATLPSIYMEAQREREEELIFRGVEYQKAIFLFRQKFQRYPRSVEELPDMLVTLINAGFFSTVFKKVEEHDVVCEHNNLSRFRFLYKPTGDSSAKSVIK